MIINIKQNENFIQQILLQKARNGRKQPILFSYMTVMQAVMLLGYYTLQLLLQSLSSCSYSLCPVAKLVQRYFANNVAACQIKRGLMDRDNVI